MKFLKLNITNGDTSFLKVQKKDWKTERNPEFNNLKKKIEELEKVIGKQTAVIETLKKTVIHPGNGK